jgi:3-oxoacid CoA-transferase
MDGVMDLVSNDRTKAAVTLEHTPKVNYLTDKEKVSFQDSSSKILESGAVSLTEQAVVDVIITEKCVFQVDTEKSFFEILF